MTAQLPFYTDDADTTEKGKFHLEISNAHDILQRDAYPAKRQNTFVFTLNYGVTNKLEVGVNVPVITLSSSRIVQPTNVSGQGDTQFGIKYRLLDERDGSKLPALSAVFYVEAPTGSVQKQLGSGIVDYYLYGIIQKSVTKKTKLRLNGGVVFSGNSSAGLIGIQRDRGQVFTGNASLVRDFTDRVTLGVEVFGAIDSSGKLDRWSTHHTTRRKLRVNKKTYTVVRDSRRKILIEPKGRCAPWIRLRFLVTGQTFIAHWSFHICHLSFSG